MKSAIGTFQPRIAKPNNAHKINPIQQTKKLTLYSEVSRYFSRMNFSNNRIGTAAGHFKNRRLGT